jgi:hypothetical protein
MKPDQRERIIKHHFHSIWFYGHSPQALYWENRQVRGSYPQSSIHFINQPS